MVNLEYNYHVVIVNNGKILRVLPDNWFDSNDRKVINRYLAGITIGLHMAGRKHVTIFAIPADDFDNGGKWVVHNDNERNRKVFMTEFYLRIYMICSLLNAMDYLLPEN